MSTRLRRKKRSFGSLFRGPQLHDFGAGHEPGQPTTAHLSDNSDSRPIQPLPVTETTSQPPALQLVQPPSQPPPPPTRPRRGDRYGRKRGGGFRLGFPQLMLIGLVLVLLIGVVGNYFSAESVYYREQQAIARRAEADALRTKAKAEADAQARQIEAAEANRRYREGCTLMTGGNLDQDGFEHQVVALTVGTAYYDTNSRASTNARAYLPEGAIICDDRFNTAVIGENGVATNFKRASDADLVNQRFADQLGWNPNARRSLVGELSADEAPMDSAPSQVLNAPTVN